MSNETDETDETEDESDERIFFQEFLSPNIETRARIYRSIDLLNFQYPQANFISLTISSGSVVIRYSPGDTNLVPEFARLMSEDAVFVPPGFDKIKAEEFSWYRRLLNCFLKDCELIGRIMMKTENEGYFLFFSFAHTRSPNFQRMIEELWREYSQGGLHYYLELQPEHLVPACQIFPFPDRLGWSVTPNSINLKVQVPSKQNFRTRFEQLKEAIPVPLLGIRLPESLQNENSGFGLLQVLEGCRIAIPIIGTNCLYVDREPTRIRPLELPEIDLDEVEAYSQDKFSDMDSYRRKALIQGPSGKWLSFLDVFQGNRIDPTNRVDFDSQLNLQIALTLHRIENGIGNAFLTGFPPQRLEPNLIIETEEDFINFYLRLGEVDIWFWEIPNLEDSPEMENALIVMTRLWSDQKLFSNHVSQLSQISQVSLDPNRKNHYLLLLNPRALSIFESSSLEPWPKDPHLQAARISEHIDRLLKIV